MWEIFVVMCVLQGTDVSCIEATLPFAFKDQPQCEQVVGELFKVVKDENDNTNSLAAADPHCRKVQHS